MQPEPCALCGGLGEVSYEDPVTRYPASMRCPGCTPLGEDLAPIVEIPHNERTPQ